MGSLQTRLLNKWKTEDKIDVIDMNNSIKPSVFNDNWLAVKVNDDYWLNVQLKITNLQGDLEIEKDIKEMRN